MKVALPQAASRRDSLWNHYTPRLIGIAVLLKLLLLLFDPYLPQPSTISEKKMAGSSPLSYRFPPDKTEDWLLHLRERGYVVLEEALSKEEVQVANNLLWKDLQDGHGVVVKKNDETTSGSSVRQWRFVPSHGIVASLAQSAGPWFVRGNANIQKAFATIWNTEDLITSMDAVLLWPGGRKPHTEGLHLDQNPFTKPQLDCIQGMVPLLPVTEEIGGLEVVPYTHTKQSKQQQRRDYPHWEDGGEFCLVGDTTPYDDNRLLLVCEPGDLILWDSRTIHGGLVGNGNFKDMSGDGGLVRMSITVAMTPRQWASPQVQEARKQGFRDGISFNHSPHEAGTSSGTFHAKTKKGYQAVELTESQQAVL